MKLHEAFAPTARTMIILRTARAIKALHLNLMSGGVKFGGHEADAVFPLISTEGHPLGSRIGEKKVESGITAHSNRLPLFRTYVRFRRMTPLLLGSGVSEHLESDVHNRGKHGPAIPRRRYDAGSDGSSHCGIDDSRTLDTAYRRLEPT